MQPRAHAARVARAAHAARALACCLLLSACIGSASATTWYVRSDGGDAAQCDGRSDTSLAARGKGRSCAWKHPFIALPPGGTPRIAGGDTLLIGAGDYAMGMGAPGSEAGCSSDWPWDCHMPPIPGGARRDAPTRILGQGFDRGCKAPPVLWGTQRANLVVNLRGSSNVEVGCLDITDRSDCVEHHARPAVRCARDAAPYGDWASTGIAASASHDVLLHDLDIHGLAHTGIAAGGLRDWTLERVRINRNGWVGWDGDIGDASSNSGAIVLRDVEIAWNGCGERWQTGKPHACWAQESGGYGDGLGTAKTAGHWLFERVRVHHNTSDGIDLLYLDGGPDASATFRQVLASSNAGNQLKTRGNTSIENSLVVGACAWFDGRFDMVDGESCRAEGNAVSLMMAGASRAVLRNNTITGQGDCLLLSEGGDARARIEVADNVFVGQPEWSSDGDGELSCGHYANDSPAQVVFAGNLFWNTKHGQCPPGSVCGRNPRLAGLDIMAFDATPLAGSPVIDRATRQPSLPVDFHGRKRPVGKAADIGAIEYAGP